MLPCFMMVFNLVISFPYVLNHVSDWTYFSSEVILTLGSSRTVLEFLCAAKEKKRSFRVFVAEGAPRLVKRLTICCEEGCSSW